MSVGRIPGASGIPTTTVLAKGDLIAGTAANAVTNLSVGTDGQTLVADSSTSTGLRYQSSMAAGKNALINGGFDVWQRGTSFTSLGVYTADRWFYSNFTSTGRTITRQATGDTTNLPNIQYCLRAQRDSGNALTGVLAISQSIETVNSIPFAGKTVTYSFYARRGANYSGATNLLSANFYSGTGTDQNQQTGYTGQASVATLDATLNTTWTRYTVTGTVASTATELSLVFFYTPTGTAGANDYFEITGVQLELGSTATTFSRAGVTFQGELAACQRYYWRTLLSSYAYAPLAVGMAISATTSKVVIPFPVYMRAVNSIDYASLNVTDLVNYTIAPTSVALDSATNTNATIASTVASGLTQYRVAYLSTNTANSGYLGFNGEL